jgi:hypothetical protein
MIRAGMALVALVVTLGLLYAAVQLARSPVSRGNLETFARRQDLTVTAANGPLILRSLALTRSWRTFGLWTGIVCGFLWAMRDAQVTLNFTTAFLGWFVGAVFAEWRIAGLPPNDDRRTASLERRTVSGYLSVQSRVVLALALVLLAGSFVAVVVMAGTTDGAATTEALLWAGAAALGLVLVGLTLRRVATRRQPPAAPELVAADDALRARAAAVLAGSVVAASGLPTATMFELIGGQVHGDGGAWATSGLGIMLLEMVVGFVVATTAARPRQRSTASAQVATTP